MGLGWRSIQQLAKITIFKAVGRRLFLLVPKRLAKRFVFAKRRKKGGSSLFVTFLNQKQIAILVASGFSYRKKT